MQKLSSSQLLPCPSHRGWMSLRRPNWYSRVTDSGQPGAMVGWHYEWKGRYGRFPRGNGWIARTVRVKIVSSSSIFLKNVHHHHHHYHRWSDHPKGSQCIFFKKKKKKSNNNTYPIVYSYFGDLNKNSLEKKKFSLGYWGRGLCNVLISYITSTYYQSR